MRRLLSSFMLWLTLCTAAFSQTGKVGINTTTPSATLHVSDSSVLFSSPFYENMPQFDAPPPISGSGARMMWYPQRRALRSGMVNGNQWDQSKTGFYSFASGYNPIANGEVSAAFGKSTVANGYSSMVIGQFNQPIVNTPQTSIEPTTPLFIIGNGDDANNTANAFAVFKNGKVGMGTNSPTDLLHLNAATGDPLRVQVAGSTKLRTWNNGGTSLGSATTPPVNGLFVAGAIEPAGGIESETRPIRIESTTDSVEIVAGNNRIVIYANGGIKIVGANSGGNHITIDAGSQNLTLKGNNISIDATGNLDMESGNQTSLTGAIVKLNNGGTPVAKIGSTVQVNLSTGIGSVISNGSPTVFTQ